MDGLARALGRRKRIAALAAAMAAFAVMPSAAFADNCDHDSSLNADPNTAIVDPAGFSWDLTATTGEAEDGYSNASGRDDAFDSFGGLFVSINNGANFYKYSNPDLVGCSSEDDGREIVFPDDTGTAAGLTLGRKVFVPATGTAFARWVDAVTNTAGTPLTFKVRWGGNLGSDAFTTIAGTSSGDQVLADADSWANTHDSTFTDPLVTSLWDGTTTPALRATKAGRFDPSQPGFVEQPNTDYISAEYNVTLEPGQTKRFMHVVALRLTDGDQTAASTELAAQPDFLVAGLSAAELASIQNWNFDVDGDGVRSGIDNCPAVANADQADLDGDKKGDACDDDTDGDGLSDAAEAAFKTDPRKADTDGDGVKDSADACPAVAAATADGCPAAIPPVVLDTTPPVATIAGLSKALSLKTLLASGLKLTVNSDEPTSFAFEILGQAKTAKLAKVGDLVVASKSLRLGTGKRTAKLTFAKKWRTLIKTKSKLTLRTVATDARGNRSTQSKTLKLKK